jgi:hypothetical protein
MRKEVVITTCDVCGKEVNFTNKEGLTGDGVLVFSFKMANGSGAGAVDTIKYEDMCIDCTVKIMDFLRGFELSQKGN